MRKIIIGIGIIILLFLFIPGTIKETIGMIALTRIFMEHQDASFIEEIDQVLKEEIYTKTQLFVQNIFEEELQAETWNTIAPYNQERFKPNLFSSQFENFYKKYDLLEVTVPTSEVEKQVTSKILKPVRYVLSFECKLLSYDKPTTGSGEIHWALYNEELKVFSFSLSIIDPKYPERRSVYTIREPLPEEVEKYL